MSNITNIIIPLQIPLVFILIIIFFQVYKFLGKREFQLLSLAWTCNLMYLLFNLVLKEKVSVLIPLSYPIGITIFNAASTFFFFFSTYKTHKPLIKQKRLILYSFCSFLILAVVLNLLPNNPEKDLVPLFIMRSIPLSVLSSISVISVAVYIARIEKEFNTFYLATLGFWVYALIQLIGIIEFENLESKTVEGFELLGFLLGFITKFVIFFGIMKLTIKVANERYEDRNIKDRLDNILGKTYHELKDPIREIHDHLNILFDKDEHKIVYNKKAKSILLSIEKEQIKISSVLQASLKMYESYLDKDLDSDITLKDDKIDLVSFNTLVELAIFNVKSFINDFSRNKYKSERYEFIRDYGKACHILCYPTDIIRVILNLLKNSYEALPDEGGKILIRTRVKETIFKDKTSKDLVFCEIEDNGSGIDQKIFDKIFEAGFSTKEKPIKGYGLHIVKELVKRNKGTIKVESPPEIKRLKYKNQGTKFILAFYQQ